MMNRKIDIIFAGVGGQGSVAVSHVLANAAIECGYTVKLTETFGAAVRGGSVFSVVRLGDVWSPLPGEGSAEFLVGLEPLEALRVGVRFISPKGWVVLNRVPWYPVDVSVGRTVYPSLESIREGLNRISAGVLEFDASAVAEQLGNTRMMNIVMLGALMSLEILEIGEDSLFEQMDVLWKPRIAEANKKAYQTGFEVGQEWIVSNKAMQ